jgi:pimeloyl-ACP methyl ester carboxylesterase
VTQVAPGILRVDTGRGVSLEVLDWGGTGRPLVFLAGGGASTPHVFDEFAPRFADSFRVLGITRRGNGGSSNVRPRRFDDLVDDIVAVLDALQLSSAVLVGHSFAGLEMALFGETHGGRCAGLIYLDSAYDYTDPELGQIFERTQPPSAPPMTAPDSASADAVLAWTERTQGMRLPASAVRATRRFDSTGRMIGAIRSGSLDWRIRDRAPRWEAISCPSLGVYAIPAPPDDALLYWTALDTTQRRSAREYYRAFAPWTSRQREAFGRVSQNQVVAFPSSNHYFFLEQPDTAERVMRTFLAQLQ